MAYVMDWSPDLPPHIREAGLAWMVRKSLAEKVRRDRRAYFIERPCGQKMPWSAAENPQDGNPEGFHHARPVREVSGGRYRKSAR